MATRALLIALRMDASQYEAEAARQTKQMRAIADETKRINADVAAATKAASPVMLDEAAAAKQLAHLQQQQAFYARISQDAGKETSLRLAAAEKELAIRKELAALTERLSDPAGQEARREAANQMYRQQAKQQAQEDAERRMAELRQEQQLHAETTAAARRAATDRRTINDRMFAATHTRTEMELRLLRRFYAEQRLRHRGDVEARLRDERAYAAERKKLMADAAMVGGPGGPAGGGMIPGAARTLIGKNIGYAGSMALGSVGGQFGSIAATAMMPGMMGLGAATAGVAVMVGIYRSAREASESLRQAQEQYTAAMQASVEWRAQLTAVETTAFGNIMAQRVRDLRQAAEESRVKGQKEPGYGLNAAWEGAQLLFTGSSDAGDERQLHLDNSYKLDYAAMMGEMTRIDEDRLLQETRIAARRAELAQAGLRTMEPGYAREDALRAAAHADARRLMDERHAEEMRREQENFDPGRDKRLQTRRAIQQGEREHQAEMQQRADVQADIDRRRQAEAMAKGLARREQAARGVRESQLQWQEMAEKLNKELNQTPERIEVMRRSWERVQQLEADKVLGKQIEEINRQIRVMTGELTEAEADFQRLMVANPEAGSTKINELIQRQQELESATWAENHAREIAELAIQYELVSGRIDEAAAAMRRFQNDNKRLSDEERARRGIDVATKQRMADEIRVAEFAKRERESLKSEEQRVQEYAMELERARMQGHLSRADQIDLLKKRREQLRGDGQSDTAFTVMGQFGAPDVRNVAYGGGTSKVDKLVESNEKAIDRLDTLIGEVRALAGTYV